MTNLEQLIAEYPMLQDVPAGVNIDEGWVPLVRSLVSVIEHWLKYLKEKPQFSVFQVKEKFGGLRFYYVGGDDFIRGAVHLAEAMSMRTCERCAAPGVLRPLGWLRTLCDTCFDKLVAEGARILKGYEGKREYTLV